MNKHDIAIIGMGTMGRALALNFSDKKISVASYNRDHEEENKIIDRFFSNLTPNSNISRYFKIEEVIYSLKSPRVILILVPAGPIVDAVIENLKPYLEPEDIVIDGGNSSYIDTKRRIKHLKHAHFNFLGCGISGGENGARHGPSIMFGGDENVFQKINHLFEKVTCIGATNKPCSQLVGNGESGHIVKAIHNGIEYSILQIILELYAIQKNVMQLSNLEIYSAFQNFLDKDKDNYLIGITENILENKNIKKLSEISDEAEQKGTGKDVIRLSLELNIPTNLISQAVNFRFWSLFKENRLRNSKIYTKKMAPLNNEMTIESLYQTFEFCSLMAFAEGVMLLKQASTKMKLNININKVFETWSNGTIIKCNILNQLINISNFDNIYENEFIVTFLEERLESIKKVLSNIIISDTPTPILFSSLNNYNTLKSSNLSTNLTQAQRDLFGRHGFYKEDDVSRKKVHFDEL